MLQIFNHLCGLSLDSFQYVPFSLVLETPALGPVLQVCLTWAEQRGSITSLSLLEMLSWVQPRKLCHKGSSMAHGQLDVHQDIRAFLTGWPSLFWCTDLFLPRGRTCHFHLLNIMRLPSAHVPILLRSLWMAAQVSGATATPPSFVLSVNLLSTCSIPVFRLLKKVLDSISPWG